jgi:hypothetical protein
MKNKTLYYKVRKLFDYQDGNLIWKKKTRGVKENYIAGTKTSEGYIRIKIHYNEYKAHRLIWLWHYGYMPENDLDHINKNKEDNRIENLREVSAKCNIRNTGNFSHNTSGVKGIHWYKSRNKWQVYIIVDLKQKNLGYYKDFDDAVLARLAAEQCLGWEGCDSNSPAYQYAIEHNLIKEINHVYL